MVAPISPGMLYKIMEGNPAASLRSSADAFEAMGRQFDAEFSRRMARAAEINPELYYGWAQDQRARVIKLKEQAK